MRALLPGSLVILSRSRSWHTCLYGGVYDRLLSAIGWPDPRNQEHRRSLAVRSACGNVSYLRLHATRTSWRETLFLWTEGEVWNKTSHVPPHCNIATSIGMWRDSLLETCTTDRHSRSSELSSSLTRNKSEWLHGITLVRSILSVLASTSSLRYLVHRSVSSSEGSTSGAVNLK